MVESLIENVNTYALNVNKSTTKTSLHIYSEATATRKPSVSNETYLADNVQRYSNDSNFLVVRLNSATVLSSDAVTSFPF